MRTGVSVTGKLCPKMGKTAKNAYKKRGSLAKTGITGRPDLPTAQETLKKPKENSNGVREIRS